MVNILFFGQLKDVLQCATMEAEGFTGNDIAQLRLWLQQRHPNWADALAAGQALAAVNQEMAEESTVVNDGDEVAFFPPVTGG